MNQSIWRLLLTCLLLLTLPLKGWAVVGMAACGMSHHRMDASMTAPAQVVVASTHEQHVHGHQASDRHEAKPLHQMGHSAQTAGSADGVHLAGDDVAQVKCGSCAPCSMGAALTGAVIVSIPALPPAAELPAIESHYLSVDLVGFERPPRTVRA